MLTILSIGDPHIKTSNILESEIMIDEILRVIVDRAPDLVVCHGDILDTHDRVNTKALLTANEMLLRMSEKCLTVLIIGNHDRPNNSDFLSHIHPFSGMHQIPNLLIADCVKEMTIKGHRLIFVPYVSPGRYHEALATIESPYESSWQGAHQEFFGVHMGSIVSVEGDKWDSEYPFVATGHIHNYHMLQENICYIGTPMQVASNESEDKGLVLFSAEDNTNGNSFVPCEKWSHERIYLCVPKKRTIYLTYRDTIEEKFPLEKDPFLKYKIVINATGPEIQSLYNHSSIKKIKEIHSAPVYQTIIKKSSLSNNDYSSKKISFLQRIKEAVEDSPDLNDAYLEIMKRK